MDINLAHRPEGATHAGKDKDGGSWYRKTAAGEWMFIDMSEDGLDNRGWSFVPDGRPAYEYVELPAESAKPALKPQDDGGAAFPQSGFERWLPEGGMSLRDYFAAKALAPAFPGMSTRDVQYAAEAAYEIADAMLAARGES